jgi:hypothetical protein
MAVFKIKQKNGSLKVAKAGLCLFFWLQYSLGYSQDIMDLSSLDSNSFCNLASLDKLGKNIYVFDADNLEKRYFEQILALKIEPLLKGNINLKSARVENAVSFVLANKNYILYNSNLFDELNFDNKWIYIGMLSHELGHFAYNHFKNSSKPKKLQELEADFYSGYVLGKMGCPLDSATFFIKRFANENIGNSYAPKDERIFSVQKGWNSSRKPTLPPPNIDSDAAKYRSVTHKVEFFDNVSTEYLRGKVVYLQDQGMLMTFYSGGADVWGLVEKNGDKYYPQKIGLVKGQKGTFYIGTDSFIYEANGTQIGKITKIKN